MRFAQHGRSAQRDLVMGSQLHHARTLLRRLTAFPDQNAVGLVNHNRVPDDGKQLGVHCILDVELHGIMFVFHAFDPNHLGIANDDQISIIPRFVQRLADNELTPSLRAGHRNYPDRIA